MRLCAWLGLLLVPFVLRVDIFHTGAAPPAGPPYEKTHGVESQPTCSHDIEYEQEIIVGSREPARFGDCSSSKRWLMKGFISEVHSPPVGGGQLQPQLSPGVERDTWPRETQMLCRCAAKQAATVLRTGRCDLDVAELPTRKNPDTDK